MMPEGGNSSDTLCERYNELSAGFFVNYLNKSELTYPGNPTIWKKLDFVRVLKISACFIIVIGGFLGNICIILIVAMKKSMKTTINIYVANLAVADAIVCILGGMPLALLVMTDGLYVLGAVMCKAGSFVRGICLINSVLTLAAISCDRFVAIVFPLHARVTHQHPSVIVAIIWIISIVGAIPLIILNKHRIVQWKNFLETDCSKDFQYEWRYDKSLGRCIGHVSLFSAFYGIFLVSISILPLSIMIIAYSFILWKVWTTKTPGEQIMANVRADSRSRKKVNKMVSVVLLAFIICWSPSQALLLYGLVHFKFTTNSSSSFVFKPSKSYPEILWFSLWIAYVNSLINPIIYAGLNKDFKDGIWSILHCVYLKSDSGNAKTLMLFN